MVSVEILSLPITSIFLKYLNINWMLNKNLKQVQFLKFLKFLIT